MDDFIAVCLVRSENEETEEDPVGYGVFVRTVLFLVRSSEILVDARNMNGNK